MPPANQEGLMRRFERDTLAGKSPPNWSIPLLNAVSIKLRDYGDNPLFHEKIGQFTHAFCDGGLTGTSGNKGTVGTWGICLVNHEDMKDPEAYTNIFDRNGLCFLNAFEDRMYPGITNNQSEFFAACMMLACLPQGWQGTVVLDSMVTVNRILYPRKRTKNISDNDMRVMWMLTDRIDVEVLQISGHQTGGDILAFANNLCDRIANLARAEFEERIKTGEWSNPAEHHLYPRENCTG